MGIRGCCGREIGSTGGSGHPWAAWVTLSLRMPLLGRLFGLLYWWIGTTWYRLTTAASLLDVFVLTRSDPSPTYDVIKKLEEVKVRGTSQRQVL